MYLCKFTSNIDILLYDYSYIKLQMIYKYVVILLHIDALLYDTIIINIFKIHILYNISGMKY